jgi:hypothetical protein
MAKRPDLWETLQKASGALAPLITALATAALAGHTIGWW